MGNQSNTIVVFIMGGELMIGQWLASMHPDFSHWIWAVIGMLFLFTGFLLDREPRESRRSWIIVISLLLVIVLAFSFGFRVDDSEESKVAIQPQQSPEPCFAILRNEATINEEGVFRLIIKTANTASSTKENISARVLLFGKDIYEDLELLHRKTMKSANSQSSGAIFDHDIGFRLNPEKTLYLSLFAVFEAGCVDGKSQNPGSQIEFLKIVPEPETGKGLVVVHANIHEKARIEEYIGEHGIPKLKR